jgi:hypothetical protein
VKVLQGDLPQQVEGDLQQHTRRGRQTLIATCDMALNIVARKVEVQMFSTI